MRVIEPRRGSEFHWLQTQIVGNYTLAGSVMRQICIYISFSPRQTASDFHDRLIARSLCVHVCIPAWFRECTPDARVQRKKRKKLKVRIKEKERRGSARQPFRGQKRTVGGSHLELTNPPVNPIATKPLENVFNWVPPMFLSRRLSAAVCVLGKAWHPPFPPSLQFDESNTPLTGINQLSLTRCETSDVFVAISRRWKKEKRKGAKEEK